MKLRTLINIWHELNLSVFGGALDVPRFFRTRSREHYAAYTFDDSQTYMYFNTDTIKGDIARSIVYHEMIHQYVEEIMCVCEQDSINHGPLFWASYRAFRPEGVVLFSELD